MITLGADVIKCTQSPDKIRFPSFVKEIQMPLFLSNIGLFGIDLAGCIIAGGAIRDYIGGDDIKDIDVFGTKDTVSSFIVANAHKIKQTTTSPLGHINCFLEGCEYPVQLITTKWADTPERLLSDFDLRMCRMAYHQSKIIVDNEAVNDTLDKILYVSSLHTPYLTLTRLEKYLARGYKLDSVTYHELLEAYRAMSDEQFMVEKNSVMGCMYDGGFPE